MGMDMNWMELVGSVMGSVALWEGVKYLLNRRNNKRIAEAEADQKEFEVLRETMTFLQQQLRENFERYDQQTDRLRKVQDECHELMLKNQQAELSLHRYRCEKRGCQDRVPPNGY